MQVVGGSVFALSYGSALIGALLMPGPDVNREQEKVASYLIIPVAGPFIAAAQPQAPLVVMIPMGIVQAGSAGVLTWGIVGGILDDELAEGDTAITVVPLSPDAPDQPSAARVASMVRSMSASVWAPLRKAASYLDGGQ